MKSPIELKSISYAIQCLKLSKGNLKQTHPDVAQQFQRCSTSIGANVSEAQFAESRADFIHKMKIATKEAAESRYWLRLIKSLELLDGYEQLENEVEEIIRILCKITISAKNNGKA